MSARKTEPISLRLPPELLAQIDAAAKAVDFEISRAAWLRRAAEEQLKRDRQSTNNSGPTA